MSLPLPSGAITPVTFDPDNYLVSAHGALKSYVQAFFDADNYDVIMSYPFSAVTQREVPLAKTVIHFDQDDAINATIGFGENVSEQDWDEGAGTVVEKVGEWHTLNFDVGIWTSQQRGADAERLRVHQLLVRIFGMGYRETFYEFTGGITIVSFNGGRYSIETIDEVPTWRVSNMELVIKFAGRDSRLPVPFTYPDSDGPTPGIVIAGNLTVTTEE